MSNLTSHVVVGYDFTASSREALLRAIKLAARSPSHVLHFVCALDPGTSADQTYASIADIVGQELRNAKAADHVHFFVHARFGKPADEILAVARDVGADLVIVGTKGLTGLERMVLGSVAEQVVREAGCAVVIARPRTYPHVELLSVTSVEPHATHYHQPHRYSYESAQVQKRPTDWPLY
jgi:nucleotide-binding universal stress UspA family protein